MHFRSLRVASLAGWCLVAASLLFAQDWKTASSLPGVDFSGLSARQKAIVLKVLREHDCSCQCGRKLAQCRVEDPGCAYSTNLAATAVAAIKAGKSEPEVLAAIDSSKWAHVQEPQLLSDPVNIPVAGAPVTGPANAAVTLVEFSDFQCPYCSAAVGQLREVLKMYPTQVKLIFKQFPLEMHPQADLAAAAAVAAHKQGKFWAMHDAMFAHPESLSRKGILSLAQQNGLEMSQFENDIDSTVVRETVVRDVQDGNQAGVEGTPTVFINGQHYNGAVTADALKQVIDSQLKLSKNAKLN
ncbi:MAG: thioredoxin domain-containing protein [Acidobacteriaceae bacterium]|nr:thioredoxin domain-containing protein [Acidobacteriaceae bacterium]